jgi:thiol-disulfide isomerase/thioredoxin
MMVRRFMRIKKLFLLLLMPILLGVHSFAFAANSFDLKDMAGKKHTLAQYKGKWVLVNYWATWCPPCLEEVPDLVALYDSRKNKDVMVIGIAFEYQDAKEVSDYVTDMLMSYPVVLGDDNTMKQIGFSDSLPTSYIYNPKGELVKIKHGLVTKQYLDGLMVREK